MVREREKRVVRITKCKEAEVTVECALTASRSPDSREEWKVKADSFEEMALRE